MFSAYWHIVILFFIIAILYSSAGFGGGSSYLAVLALTSLAYTEIRAISLLCNIVVVTGGSYIYFKNGLIDWKKILPLVLASIPFAFIGGWIKINQNAFFILLGISLIVAATSMYISKRYNDADSIKYESNLKRDFIFGSGIGFLSGIVGIGGGIFLAPLLHLTYWGTPKKIAAAASIFILFNSISGLVGQTLNPNFFLDFTLTLVLILAVFLGGQIGSRLSANLFSQIWVKRITAVVIAIVGVRILWDKILMSFS